MFGDIISINDNTLMIEGKIPVSILEEPDICNIVLHKSGSCLYIFDSGATDFIKKKIIEVASRLQPYEKVILLNTHSHPDHTGNNSVINALEAKEKQHFISGKYISLNHQGMFSQGFSLMNHFFPVLGDNTTDEIIQELVKGSLRIFNPLEPSPETATAYESLTKQNITIGSETFAGWVLNNEVYVIESAGHSADHVMFYIPKIKMLIAGDETFQIFPIFLDGNGMTIKSIITRCLDLAKNNEIAILVDGHHHKVYHNQESIALLTELLNNHNRFYLEVMQVAETRPGGIYVQDIYEVMKQKLGIPEIAYYFQFEFPKMPIYMQSIILIMLLNAGYKPEDTQGKKILKK